MNRLTILLAAVAGILAGALGYGYFNQPTQQMDEVAVRAIVEQMLEDQAAQVEAEPIEPEVASIDPAVLNPMIEQFLLDDPKVLQRASTALEQTLRAEEAARSETALAEFRDQIFNAPDQIVLGNPDGDVTLVEFFDYNCGYCRAALPDMATLLAEDPNLRIILKEFPILSNESIDAARIGVLVGESDANYWDFHSALFTSRGKIDKSVALAAAQDLGLSPVELELQMGDPRVAQTIQSSYEIAQALGITGTPTYIIGNEIIPGAIGADELRARIADMRECGKTQCS
ncbi:thiol-disulfide isomerase/thioredoxin [Devosia subaequoris]|uniref:Thiol-disulfide isomerase/thioredoxin n=1 Tax=Devosia subaequoris TaxID=395930 RepID=A0A7W6IIX2_9HYPH|nr:DsbA family protein [Devosia subaequoris]MBB4050475.1 thiol-disulfide isomerase/thioredoxin [Devosia subaequoris]MCP1208837.1 DsbA family protein [Devosia subaequoris]